ncbi:MAG: hypothetical protein JSV80_09065, partial [Acidobacteriota bacterium]
RLGLGHGPGIDRELVATVARRSKADHFLANAQRLSRDLLGIWNPWLPQHGSQGRLLSRRLLTPRLVLASGEAMWWPLKHWVHWSLLPPNRAGIGFLVHRSIREIQQGARNEHRPPRRWLALRVPAALLVGGLLAMTPIVHRCETWSCRRSNRLTQHQRLP